VPRFSCAQRWSGGKSLPEAGGLFLQVAKRKPGLSSRANARDLHFPSTAKHEKSLKQDTSPKPLGADVRGALREAGSEPAEPTKGNRIGGVAERGDGRRDPWFTGSGGEVERRPSLWSTPGGKWGLSQRDREFFCSPLANERKRRGEVLRAASNNPDRKLRFSPTRRPADTFNTALRPAPLPAWHPAPSPDPDRSPHPGSGWRISSRR
jgi:hypothetical protein